MCVSLGVCLCVCVCRITLLLLVSSSSFCKVDLFVDRNQVYKYSRVEVHWPCEWLKGGITIVDSPGVGEDPELTELVKRYLPKSFGFIYVINTPNAGGIDPDRVSIVMD